MAQHSDSSNHSSTLRQSHSWLNTHSVPLMAQHPYCLTLATTLLLFHSWLNIQTVPLMAQHLFSPTHGSTFILSHLATTLRLSYSWLKTITFKIVPLLAHILTLSHTRLTHSPLPCQSKKFHFFLS
jgi:hypothetical protein